MAGSFLSENWFEVAQLRPRLREHARASRQRFRGTSWHVVHDPLTNRSHRFSLSAWWLAAQLDGKCTVDQAWQRAMERLGDAAPSQDEVIGLLAQLHGVDLLVSEARPDSAELLERRSRQMRPKWIAGLLNPMAVRLPLWDPDRFLTRTAGAITPLIGYAGAAAWLAVMLAALFLGALHYAELSGTPADRLLSGGTLVSLALVFPVVKLLHELAHGYAVKAGGGEVHEAGIMLLVLAPAPYVDASASSAFRSKWYRAFVAGAGMMAELLLAALALFAWLAVEPGMLRTTAFNVILVAGISTLLFNANPLMRYDGYYILCDLIEIPNLAQRANKHFAWLARRHLLLDRDAVRPPATRGEARWFFAYAPLAFACRNLVALSIALFVANEYFFVGVLLAIWSFAGMIVMPALKCLRFLVTSPTLERRRTRVLAACTAAFAAAFAFAAFVPLPSVSVAQGVVWVSEGAEVRAAASGFVLRAPTGTLPMAAGQPILEVEDREASARLEEQQARVAEMRTQAALDLSQDRARAFQSRQALDRESAVLADAEQRVADLVTVAAAAGRFVPGHGNDLRGRYVKRGELIGYMLGTAPVRTVRAVVAQDDIGRVLGQLRRIEIKLADRIDETVEGKIARLIPQGSESLPSKALAVEGGGELALDPRYPSALQTIDKVFQLDIALAPGPDDVRIGTRAFVRFSFAPEPLLDLAARKLRQLFLARLHV